MRGASILWGVSFLYNVPPGGREIDRWMDLSRIDASAAQKRFVSERGSVLAELLRYKIDLRDLRLQIVPFSVKTNDQRVGPMEKSGHRRVYTQFVFRVRVSAEELNCSARPDVGSRAPGIQVFVLPERTMSGADL